MTIWSSSGPARRNTLLAAAYDLKVFFGVVGKDPLEVTTADVFGFVKAQRQGRRRQGGAVGGRVGGLALSTIRGGCRRCRASTPIWSPGVRRGDGEPGAAWLATRREAAGDADACRWCAVRQLPRILAPGEVDALLGALRKRRDRAMVEAMLLGGLRRCEVLGLRLDDVRVAERRVFVADGKGGHQRLVPIANTVLRRVGDYLDAERPARLDAAVFVVLKGPDRGRPLSAEGLDEIIAGARQRAGLEHGTCHQLRHTCLTRLREAGMALEAVQAQAGHRSIESTRIYLHLTNDWLAGEYRRAAELIDATGELIAPSKEVPS